MSRYLQNKIYTSFALVAVFLVFVSIAGAAGDGTFVPLTGIPGAEGSPSITTYVNVLFTLSIAAAGMLAVIKIALAGISYMFSESSVGSKEKAKTDITGAVVGLLIILTTVIILKLIYPGLVSLNIFRSTSGVVGSEQVALLENENTSSSGNTSKNDSRTGRGL